jgi:hypothetical protein
VPVATGTGHALQLITLNPSALDASRRADIQLITVDLDWDGLLGRPADLSNIPVSTHLSNARLWEFVNTVDWKKVEALAQ